MPFASDTASPSSVSPGAPASLATLVAAAESVESRVLGWLHSLPESPANLSISDLNSAAQALWRLTAVRKTLSLIAGYAPPTRPRGVHVMPPDADPEFYPFNSKEEYDAHLAWGLEMSIASARNLELWEKRDAPRNEPVGDSPPAPADTAPSPLAQTPDPPNPQSDPSAHPSPSPERPNSSPAVPQDSPPRALSIPACPAIPGKFPAIPSGAPPPPAAPLLSANASQSVSNEASKEVAEPTSEGPHGVGRLFKPTLSACSIPAPFTFEKPITPEEPHNVGRLSRADEFPPPPNPAILADHPRPEGPTANSPARQGGVSQAIPPEARRADTSNSVPFPKSPLEFGVVIRPTRPPRPPPGIGETAIGTGRRRQEPFNVGKPAWSD